MVLLLTTLLAQAAPDTLTWDLTINDRKVGERTLVVTEEDIAGSALRTLQATTKVDAKVLGIDLAYEQKLTANADIGPASFVSQVERGADITEVQGRRAAFGWVLTLTGEGRTRTWELGSDEVDLSTADLMDPDSRVPLSRFTAVKVLTAESGNVIDGRVEALGPSEITVAGAEVPVEGYRLVSDQGTGTFHYTSEGWLVRFETKILGQRIAGTLTAPPPRGPDDEPVPIFGPGLESTPL